MRIRPCVLILKKNKALLLKYRYGDTYVFGLPGGSMDTGETLEQTVLREVKEELSVDIKISRLIFIGEILQLENQGSILNCIFLGKIDKGILKTDSVHTSALGFEWIDISKLPDLNLYPNIGMFIAEAYKNNFSRHNIYLGKIEQKWF